MSGGMGLTTRGPRLVLGTAAERDALREALDARLAGLVDDGAGEGADAMDVEAATSFLDEEVATFPADVAFDDGNALAAVRVACEGLGVEWVRDGEG